MKDRYISVENADCEESEEFFSEENVDAETIINKRVNRDALQASIACYNIMQNQEVEENKPLADELQEVYIKLCKRIFKKEGQTC